MVTNYWADLPTFNQYPALHDHAIEWAGRQLPLLLPAITAIAADPIPEPAVRFISAWALLSYTSGILDNYADRDKDFPAWEALGRDAGTSVALALIGEALTLSPTLTLTAALRDAALGQAMPITTIEDYETAARLKSGRIFAALFGGLAEVLDLPVVERAALDAFGEQVGILIQLHNDYSGVWDATTASDLQANTPTLPVLYMLHGPCNPGLKAAFLDLWSAPAGERDEAALLRVMEAAPVKTFLRGMMLATQHDALQVVSKLDYGPVLIAWLSGLTA